MSMLLSAVEILAWLFVFLIGHIVPIYMTSVTGQVNVINVISVSVLDTNFLWWRGCTL
jgi:hypothetical protein